jgi:molybdopterin-guanine dinucleotide biosynthesis protein A
MIAAGERPRWHTGRMDRSQGDGREGGAGPAATGAVLAGGAGRRMGGPKPSVELAGRPLIGWALEALAGAGLDPVVVAKRDSPLPKLDCPVVVEPDDPVHPLAGVIAALEAVASPTVIIAADMPFVPAQLLSWLASLDAPVAVAEGGGRLHPLLGRYEPAVLGGLRSALEGGRSMRAAALALHPLIVGEAEIRRFGPPERILFNVNDPNDLDRAEWLASGLGFLEG